MTSLQDVRELSGNIHQLLQHGGQEAAQEMVAIIQYLEAQDHLATVRELRKQYEKEQPDADKALRNAAREAETAHGAMVAAEGAPYDHKDSRAEYKAKVAIKEARKKDQEARLARKFAESRVQEIGNAISTLKRLEEQIDALEKPGAPALARVLRFMGAIDG